MDVDPPREDQEPRQQGLGWWDAGVLTNADVAAGQQGAGGHQKSGAAVKKTEPGAAEVAETQEGKTAGTAPAGAPGGPTQLRL